MSLSKPFRLFDLPLIALENVLLLTKPKDLLFFALSSENARELLRKFSLVKYFDIDVDDTSVRFSICFKSGKPIKWKFTMKLPVNASDESRHLANFDLLDNMKKKIGVFKLDDMRMVLFKHLYVMRCSPSKEHFLDYTQRIGYLIQSICPGKRIRTLDAGKVGWEDEKVLFYMDRNTRCDNFCSYKYDQDNFLEILEKTDVKRKITLACKQKEDSNLEWMNNEKIRNISQLHLRDFGNLDFSQLFKMENEHLDLMYCRVNGSVLNSYFKKWMNGEFTKRRTLEVTYDYEQELGDTVLNGLKIEPMETWENLGKPRHVRFSAKFYLNPMPSAAHSFYQTVLLKNCRGQFATVVQTSSTFYFTQWDHPLPPIDIPKGRELREISDWPFTYVVPRNV